MIFVCKRCGDFLDSQDSPCKRCGEIVKTQILSCSDCGSETPVSRLFCETCLTPILNASNSDGQDKLSYLAQSASSLVTVRAAAVLEGSLRFPASPVWPAIWTDLKSFVSATSQDAILNRGLQYATILRSEEDARKICAALTLDTPSRERLKVYEFVSKAHPRATWPLDAIVALHDSQSYDEPSALVRQLVNERKAIALPESNSQQLMMSPETDAMADTAIAAGTTVAVTSAVVGTATVVAGGAITYGSIVVGSSILILAFLTGVTGLMMCITICLAIPGVILLGAASALGTLGAGILAGGSMIGIGTSIGGAFAGAAGTVAGSAIGIGGAVRKQSGVRRRK